MFVKLLSPSCFPFSATENKNETFCNNWNIKLVQRKSLIININNEIYIMFQPISAPVHCFAASRKWTPDPTLNKKNQYCSVIVYPVKEQATRHIWKSWFSYESISALWARISQVTFLCNVGPDRSRQNCRLFFCAKWANIAKIIFLSNVVSGRSRQHCIIYFPVKTCLCALGQLCASNFLCNVFSDVSNQHWLYNVVLAWPV